MTTKNDLPFKISIASPCTARWEDMGGSDQVRFCDHCRKNVYNLSAMTAAEAANLLQATNGKLCARIYQRADGTVLTADCPVGIAKQWRRVKSLVVGAAAFMVLVVVNFAAFGRGNDTNKVKVGLGTNKLFLMGKVRAQPATNSIPHVTMGSIAMPVTNQPPVKK